MKNGNLTVYSKTAFRSALLTKYVVQKSYNSRYRLDYLNEVIGSLQKIALDSSITAIENDTAKSLYRDCVDLYIRATVYAASLKRDLCLYDALNELCDFLYEELARGSFPISSVPLSDYLCRYTSTLFKDKSLLKNKS